MEAGVIVAIVTGGFGFASLVVQKLFDIKCTKNENEDGSVKNVHCVPRCKNCVYPIPKQNIKCILPFYREPPYNWNVDEAKYTKKLGTDDSYLVIMPKKLKIVKENNKWQGSAIFYKEFTKKSDSKIWFLDTDLDYIKNTKAVKLFIKRFSVKNGSWTSLIDNCEYITATNGRNLFEANSYIGDILTETKVKYDEDGNAEKYKKTYLCTHEQIGIIIYSKSDNDLITPDIGYCNNNESNDKILDKKIKDLAIYHKFDSEVVDIIDDRATSTCKINSIYIGDVSLYVFDNRNILQ